MFGLFRRQSSFGQERARKTLSVPPSRVLLQVESLEDRTVPTTFNIANGDVPGLIAAINTANANAQADTINLAAGGTFTLTAVNNGSSGNNGLPVIGPDGGNNLTINGNGATILRGVGAPTFRILFADNAGATLFLDSVTIKNGQGTSGFDGGGIRVGSNGNLNLSNSLITGNTTTGFAFGGGIGARPGSVLNISNSTVSGNNSSARAGGISFYKSASETLVNTTISNNTANGNGGGVLFYLGNGTVQNCTIANNTSTSRGGGVKFVGSAANTLKIDNTTISGNKATDGGGLYLKNGISTIQNTTVSGNMTTTGNGGGMVLYRGSVTLRNATIAGNICTTGSGGGLFEKNAATTVTLQNTLLSGNTDNSGQRDIFRGSGTLNASNNLIQAGSTFINGTNSGNITGVAPSLGALQNNGGPLTGSPGNQTPLLTQALLPGSRGIDEGSNAFSPGTTDERGAGFNRIINGIIDIGAYEYQPPATNTTIVSSLNPSLVGQSVTFTATVAGLAPGSNVPQGTLTFYDGTTVLGTGMLVNGSFSFTTAALAVGSHTITAQYSGFTQGDYALAGSTGALTQTVTAPPPPPPPPVVTNGLIAVGTDAGVPAEVKVYDARTKALKFDLLPFGGFTGGVRVAVGDVNHDGTPDIVTGAGPGGGPQVRVFDGVTGQPLAGVLGSFYGLAAGFNGGVFVAAGDTNADGFADVIVGADAGGGPQVTVYSGKDGSVLASFYGLSAAFPGGVRVAAGDVDGDGKADIIVGAGKGGGPQVTVYSGAGGGVLASFFAFPPNFTGGVYVAAGNVNGDGKADIVTGAGPGGGPQVTVFDGSGRLLSSFYANNPKPTDIPTLDANAHAGVRVGTTTVGSKTNILTGPGPGTAPLVDVFSGQTLALLDSFFAYAPSFRGGVFVGG